MNTTENNVLKETEAILKEKFEQNDDFKTELFLLYNVYAPKYLRFVKDEMGQKRLQDMFFEAIKGQIFHGYYLIRELLADENTHISNEFLGQPIGYLTNEVPLLLGQALGDNSRELIKTEVGHKFLMWLITNYEGTFDLAKQVLWDLTCLGARQALLDEKESKNIGSNIEKVEGLLSVLNDLEFLTPQLYLSAAVVTDSVEMWEINYWNSYRNHHKAGDVSVIKVENQDETGYLVAINLHVSIFKEERESIVTHLVGKLVERNNINPSALSISVGIVEEYSAFVINQNHDTGVNTYGSN
ncbi:hypothetical protein ACFSCX_06660 [Bacillus salitolerans]|uniref:Uncharacterized protein n=1 Tax=Bacillus salitolerans TaxID=1437434 RepID=A0ABW4LM29_9BACI